MLAVRTLTRAVRSSALPVSTFTSSTSTSTSQSSFSRAFHATPAPLNNIKVSVNGVEVEVPNGSTVLQACEIAGVHVPRFCYHDRLSIAGNCRMCLVEVEKSPKPVASCAMPAMPGNKIKTNTPVVAKAREGVMEFLLANHPLDCPICDQGGECDLQDQSMKFGSDRSRFREVKRTVEDKNIGPFVKTVMTRCIHCTRCVRFAAEVAGVEALGTTGRGNNMEIGTYVTKNFDSELSGNVIDLCPVGALTSKPFAFTARPWELVSHETIDVMDGVGSNVRIETRGNEIMRVIPRLHEDINEEWIGDKTRFAYDGLKRQRLDIPMIKKDGELRPATWSEVFDVIKTQLGQVKGNEILGIAGDQADAESIIALKDLLNRLGSNNTQSSQHAIAPLNADVRSNYLFNSRISGIDESDVVLLVGTNPRMEAAIINARLRRNVRYNELKVASIGPEVDLAFRSHQHLGNNSAILNEIAEGKHAFSKVLASAKKPIIIFGLNTFSSQHNITPTINKLRSQFPNLVTSTWNGVNVLQTTAGRVATQDLGFVPGVGVTNKPAKFVYLLASDIPEDPRIDSSAFVVYQGHHGDVGASRANVILPGAAYTEKSGTYVNTEGRVQRTKAVTTILAQAREDWKIIRALSQVLNHTLPYDTIEQVRARLSQVSPTFAAMDTVESTSYNPVHEITSTNTTYAPFAPLLENYFQTDPISRSSKIMARATVQLPTSRNSYTSNQGSDSHYIKEHGKQAVQTQASR